MPRAITPAMLAAMSSPTFKPAIFVQAQFKSTTVYLWTGFGPVVWNGQTWSGLGALLSIGETIEDGSTVEARGITLTLSGIDSTLLPECLNDVRLGLPVTVWLGALSSGAVVADPVILWSGGMDQPIIDANSETAVININCENLLVSMDVPVDRRYTTQDQQMDWPGDLGFLFVDALQEQTIFWGTQATATNNL